VNEQYDRFAVSPDREFDARLRAELEARLAARQPSATNLPKENEFMTIQPDRAPSRRRWLVPIAVSMIAVLGVGVVAAVASRDTDTPTAPVANETVAPTTLAPTTTPAPTTTTIPPPTDADIAAGVLLKNSEYDPQEFYIAPGVRARMDADIARQLPECAKYVDTVFESSARQAATADEFFGRLSSTEPAGVVEYVVVHPSADQAAAMFDAMQEPAFLDGCVPAYVSTLPQQCCSEHEAWFPVDSGNQPDPPKLDVGADDTLITSTIGTRTDEHGVVHGPEGFAWTAVRVGRVVAMIEVLTTATDGSTVTSIDQFEAIVKRMVERAASAQNGRILP
jgi:hypothetical protein